MSDALPPELQKLDEGLAAAERDARALVAGLTEAQGAWRPEPGSWSVAECIDHLATGNRVYLDAMLPVAVRARAAHRERRRPALPGLIGGWFVKSLEPPVKARFKMKAPRKSLPRTAPPLRDAMTLFLTTQSEVRTFLRTYANLDLASVRFPNPFVRGIRFSLATGLHVIEAHERRHLLQAWRVRQAADREATERA